LEPVTDKIWVGLAFKPLYVSWPWFSKSGSPPNACLPSIIHPFTKYAVNPQIFD
jgi:hypothetical protein